MAPKRAFAALDDEEESDRKLQKLDLPPVLPEIQTGDAEDQIGDDLAVEEDIKPEIKDEKMDVDEPKVEEEEEDELEAFMKQNNQEVKRVNTTDAKKLGLLNLEDDSDDEAEVKDKAGDELAKAEAILAYVCRCTTLTTLTPGWLLRDHGKRTCRHLITAGSNTNLSGKSSTIPP